MTTSFPGPSPRARTQASALMLCLALPLAAGLSACTDAKSAAPSQTRVAVTHVAETTPAVPISVVVGRIVGRLPASRRRAVRKQVAVVIDRWWEAAYLSSDEAGAGEAFPGFTEGARSRARADRALMTNKDIESASITPLMRKVRLDLLAVNKRARSVTARFDLRVRVSDPGADARPRRLQLRGRVFLTHRPGGWKVFGYDVSRGWL